MLDRFGIWALLSKSRQGNEVMLGNKTIPSPKPFWNWPFCTGTFLRNNAGNAAIILGLAAVPIMLAVGIAVDYSRYSSHLTELQAAVDSGALTVAASSGKDKLRIADGEKVFFTNAVGLSDAKIQIKIKGTSVEAVATAKMDVSLMKLAGFGELKLEAKAVAEGGAPNPNIFLVLDQSASMGIGADQENREKLMALTKPYIWAVGGWATDTVPNGCAFACHLPIDINPPGKTIYDLARENGVRIREDVLAEGATQFISELLDSYPDAKAGTIGFSRDVVWLARPTNRKDDLIDSLGAFPKERRMDTPFETVLPTINEETKKESGGKPRIIVMVTDGARSITDSFGLNISANGPLDESLCRDIKQDGSILVVLEVKYEKDPDSIPYQHYVQSFEEDISPALKACATSGHFYSASNPDEIHAALSQIVSGLSSERIWLSQ